MKLFAAAIRDARPDARFTSTEVQAWAKAYYSTLSEDLPSLLQSPKHISRLLKEYGEETKIIQAPEAQYGRKVFMVI